MSCNGNHGDPKDCPCCFVLRVPMTERSIVGLFIMARSSALRGESVGRKLCERHAHLAVDLVDFVRKRLEAGENPNPKDVS